MSKKEKVMLACDLESPWPFPTNFSRTLDPSPAAMSLAVEDSLLNEAKANLKYVYIKAVGGYRYTIAYRPAVKGNRVEFVDIAVAVCSPNDQYVKRVGRDLAVSRMLNGNFITLPLAYYGLDLVPSILHGMLGGEQ